MKKFYFLFLFALIASISNLYAAEVTYTFTSKTWEATSDGVAANWTSKKMERVSRKEFKPQRHLIQMTYWQYLQSLLKK